MRNTLVIMCALAVLAWAVPAGAETRDFVAAYDWADWATESNWDPSGVPDPNDALTVDTGLIVAATDLTVGSDGGTGSLTLGEPGTTLYYGSTTFGLILGSDSGAIGGTTGTVEISSGAQALGTGA
ncbi:MAG: hypothetical protein K8R91_01905, partial [Phycisphaerae bacterium]|nr:hypothetical protein [Phycisphaerae bacterium]